MRRFLALSIALALGGFACFHPMRPALPEPSVGSRGGTPAPPSGGESGNKGCGEYRATNHRRFDDVEHWRKVFDDPERPTWQQPQMLLHDLGVIAGMRVADLGAGTGFFLPYLSRSVGPSGRVFAVEVERELVAHLRARVAQERLDNVEVLLTPYDSLALAPGSVDLLLIVDTYHHIDRRREYFEGAASALTRQGHVAIVDWKPGDLPIGPREENHKVRPEQVVREMRAAGYAEISSSADLPYQYVLVFAPVVGETTGQRSTP